MLRWIPFAVATWLAVPCVAATKIVVTVVEQKSGRPVLGLKAVDFTVLDDGKPRRVSKEANRAVSAAMRKSQASAISKPPPTATPFTAAMIGL